MTSAIRYELGRLEVDEPARLVRVAGQDVPVEPKVFDLLVFFAHRSGEVIGHDELLEAVWGRSIASDSVVSQAIFKLRRILKQHAGLPDALVTLRGVGFRLDARIAALETSPGQESTRRLDWRTAVPALVLLAGLLVWWQAWRLSEPGIPRIALLEVENATGDAGLDWVEAGGSALISEQLARRGIEVVSSRQLQQLSNEGTGDVGPADAAAMAGVDRVFVPRLLPDADGYRLELVSLSDDSPTRLELTGSGPATLSLAMSGMLADHLRAPLRPPAGALGLGSPFLDEAYARAYHHRLAGDYDEAIRLYEYILGEAPDAHWASYHLSITARYQGEVERSRALLEALLDAPLADAWLAAAVRSSLGNLAWYAGEYALAESLYEQARERFAAHNMIGGVASVLGNLGMLDFSRGDFAAGRERAREALVIYRRQGNHVQHARLLHNIGYSHFDQGDYDRALDLLEQALALRVEYGLRDQAANTRSVIAEIAIEQGRLDEGQRLLEQSLADFELSGNERRRGLMLADLADVALRRGQYGPAREYGLEALALASARGEPTSTATAAMAVGRALHALGDFMGAEAHYRRAGDQWRQVDNERGQLSSLAERARLALDRGDPEPALVLIDEMGGRAEALDNPRYRLIHRSLRAQWQIAQGQSDAIVADLEAILDDTSDRAALRAVLIAEIAERLHQDDPGHEFMSRVLPLMIDWAPRHYPAARLLYLTAASPRACRRAEAVLEQLTGPDWAALAPDLVDQTACQTVQ